MNPVKILVVSYHLRSIHVQYESNVSRTLIKNQYVISVERHSFHMSQKMAETLTLVAMMLQSKILMTVHKM